MAYEEDEYPGDEEYDEAAREAEAADPYEFHSHTKEQLARKLKEMEDYRDWTKRNLARIDEKIAEYTNGGKP